jgi:hypothetical protein
MNLFILFSYVGTQLPVGNTALPSPGENLSLLCCPEGEIEWQTTFQKLDSVRYRQFWMGKATAIHGQSSTRHFPWGKEGGSSPSPPTVCDKS